MSKTAVCLFGLPRGSLCTWHTCLQYLVAPLDASLFVHTWKLLSNTENWHKTAEPTYSNLIRYAKYMGNARQLRAFSFELQEPLAQSTILKGVNKLFLSNQYYMWASAKRSADMAASDGSKYDYLIFTRPDIGFVAPLASLNLSKDQFFHSGSLAPTGSYECEDLLFCIPFEYRFILDLLVQKTRSSFYVDNLISNPLLYECKASGLEDVVGSFKWPNCISIIRHNRPLSLYRFFLKRAFATRFILGC